uniref:Uncharacterized protein n=1 Tax=Wuchereria bancrofti TaxID=6293 RepID=A0AAF5PUN4_WUCBA
MSTLNAYRFMNGCSWDNDNSNKVTLILTYLLTECCRNLSLFSSSL